MSSDCCCECSPPEFGGRLPDRECPLHGEGVVPNLHTCGYIEDSFACKIRHLSVNVGNLKRERER